MLNDNRKVETQMNAQKLSWGLSENERLDTQGI